MTALAYGPAYRAGFIWDDDSYVVDNTTLRDVAGLGRIWLEARANPQYYPMVFTSFWIERRLWGLEPLGYHAVNVGLHAACAVLLWRLLRALAIPGAWLGGALFALHPVHVESVAWIAERKNVLSGAFFLAAALVYVRGALARPEGAGRTRAGWRAPVSFALFACALLSKTVTAVLPVSLAILLFWKRGRLERRDAAWLGAMLVLGASAASRTAWLEVHQVGAQGEAFDLSLVQRCLVAGRAFWFYLGKLVWPVPLSFVYPRWEADAGAAEAWALLVGAVAFFAGLGALVSRLGGGPLAAFLHFAAALAPASGLFNVYPMRYSFVADHFQYLASLGPISLAAAASSALASRVAALQPRALLPRGAVASWARAAALVLLLVLGCLTWKQAGSYRDSETLWRATLRANPAATLAHWNLGRLVEDRGRLNEAIFHYRAALAFEPDNVELLVNLGNALARTGALDEALDCFERAVRKHPRHPTARYNLAVVLESKGDTGRALAEYLAALRELPDPAALRTDFQLQVFRKARLGELSAAVHARLGDLLVRLGNSGEAMARLRAALESGPAPAGVLVNLANLLAGRDRPEEAIALYRKAIEAEPDHALAHYNLALAYEQRSDVAGAMAEYREALRCDPGLGAAHNNLAVLYYKLGDYGEAWRAVERARSRGVEPHPDFLRALAAKSPPPPTF